jgi:DNA gyrase subunit A
VGGISTEDLIIEEEMVVTVSHMGYIKRTALTNYRAQRRGGKGITVGETRDEDFIDQLFTASTHAFILFFSRPADAHWLGPRARCSDARRGAGAVNAPSSRRASAAGRRRCGFRGVGRTVPARGGVVKKTAAGLREPSRWIIAIHRRRRRADRGAAHERDLQQVLIASRQGKAIRFPEEQVRSMGRTAAGVRGMTLRSEDAVVGMEILSAGATILTATQNGFGKRTPLEDYRLQRRGGQGVITIRTSARNGPVVGVAQVVDDDEVIHYRRMQAALPRDTISTMGRAVQECG